MLKNEFHAWKMPNTYPTKTEKFVRASSASAPESVCVWVFFKIFRLYMYSTWDWHLRAPNHETYIGTKGHRISFAILPAFQPKQIWQEYPYNCISLLSTIVQYQCCTGAKASVSCQINFNWSKIHFRRFFAKGKHRRREGTFPFCFLYHDQFHW